MNKHMDDAFKRMSEDFKVTYDKSYWEAAKAGLDDDNLDNAFKTAASAMEVSPVFDGTQSVDDMFMDAAFVDASSEVNASYDASFFNEFLSQQGELIMDDAFNEASTSVVVDYIPEYWNDADKALTNEGLHYEYDSAYWAEAKKLLDRSDRKVFFGRWTSVAIALLLISFGGQYLIKELTPVIAMENNSNLSANEVAISIQDMNIGHESSLLKLEEERSNFLASSTSETTDQLLFADNESTAATHLDNQIDEEIELDTQLDDVIEVTQGQGSPSMVEVGAADNSVTPMIDHENDILNDEDGIDNEEHLSSPASIEVPTTIDNLNSPAINNILYDKKTPKVTIEKIKPRTAHTLSFVGATGLGNKWGDFSFLPTLRNSFGLEYLASSTQRFKNFELGGSLMLNHVKQNNLGFEDRITEYNAYGVTKYYRSVALNNMFYANANFLFNHRIAPKHKLKFGVGFEYLLAANSNMSYVNGKTNELEIVNNNWGIKEGLNKIDVRLTVGYEFQISNLFALQVNTNYGVFDRTDDFYLKSTEKNVDIGVMVGLKYNLF
ncbi:MAG: hypothetical protein R2780_05770 [Crocinitomicaceae bacterium]